MRSVEEMKSPMELFGDATEDASTEATTQRKTLRAYSIGETNRTQLTWSVCKVLSLLMRKQNDSKSTAIVDGNVGLAVFLTYEDKQTGARPWSPTMKWAFPES